MAQAAHHAVGDLRFGKVFAAAWKHPAIQRIDGRIEQHLTVVVGGNPNLFPFLRVFLGPLHWLISKSPPPASPSSRPMDAAATHRKSSLRRAVRQRRASSAPRFRCSVAWRAAAGTRRFQAAGYSTRPPARHGRDPPGSVRFPARSQSSPRQSDSRSQCVANVVFSRLLRRMERHFGLYSHNWRLNGVSPEQTSATNLVSELVRPAAAP